MKTTIPATGHYLNSPLFVTDEMLQDCLAHMPEMLPVKDGELGARLVGVMRDCRREENRIVGELELVPGLARRHSARVSPGMSRELTHRGRL